jgi:hypothetical protein
MKKLLLLSFTFCFFGIKAQILQQDNFNTLTLGNVGTDITGVTAGQDGWFSFASNGTAPTTGTNAANTNFQIVSTGFESTNGVKIIGSNGNKGSRFLWKNGLPEAWAARTVGNDIIQIEYDFFTGPTTTSTSQFGVRLFGSEGTNSRILNGFVYNANTRILQGVAYLDNAGTFGNFLITLATGGLILEENTWYRIGFGYDTETGEPLWNAGDGTSSVAEANWAGPFDVEEVDFVVGTPTTNAAVSEITFDNLLVEAVNVESLLNVTQISKIVDFSVYPNPATNLVTVSSASDFSIKAIDMFDINGRIIKSIAIDNLSNVEVNISDLSTGVYMMKIASDQGTSTKKIIKQ